LEDEFQVITLTSTYNPL